MGILTKSLQGSTLLRAAGLGSRALLSWVLYIPVSKSFCLLEFPEGVNSLFLFVCFRFADIDPETGIEITQSFTEPTKDVYPIHIVENKDGIQGSCAFFKQRTDVTKHVRSKSLTPLVNLQEALERFDLCINVFSS